MDDMLIRARAPEGFEEVRAWPLAAVDELAVLREDLDAALPGGPRTSLEEVPESVVLVASELATNALRHGRGPAIVRLAARAGRSEDSPEGSPERELLLEVIDRAPERAPELAARRRPGPGGFGLQLAARLADELGWYRTARAKHVWARFTVRTPDLHLCG